MIQEFQTYENAITFYVYLNLNLFIVFDAFKRQLNITMQILANASKRDHHDKWKFFEDGIETEMKWVVGHYTKTLCYPDFMS